MEDQKYHDLAALSVGRETERAHDESIRKRDREIRVDSESNSKR